MRMPRGHSGVAEDLIVRAEIYNIVDNLVVLDYPVHKVGNIDELKFIGLSKLYCLT